MATPLGMEKYGRIDILPERWVPLDQNAPKLVLTHVKWNFSELFFIHYSGRSSYFFEGHFQI